MGPKLKNMLHKKHFTQKPWKGLINALSTKSTLPKWSLNKHKRCFVQNFLSQKAFCIKSSLHWKQYFAETILYNKHFEQIAHPANNIFAQEAVCLTPYDTTFQNNNAAPMGTFEDNCWL